MPGVRAADRQLFRRCDRARLMRHVDCYGKQAVYRIQMPIDSSTVGNRPVAEAITSLAFALIGFVTTNGRWTLATTATLIATRRGGLPDQPP